MREIKFRAWDKWTSKMIQPNDGDFIGWHAMSNWKDCLEVMQFTGLHDKNGVEIYEEDVVEDHVGVGVVKYSEDNAGFRVSYGNGRAKWFYDYTLSGERESIVVIGNLHQNPELMENKHGL